MSENFYRPTWSGFCIKFAKQVNGSSCFLATWRDVLTRHMLSWCVCPSLKSVLYQKDWTNWAGFWRGCFHLPFCAKEIRVSPKMRIFLWNFVPSSGLKNLPKLVDGWACWLQLQQSACCGWTVDVILTVNISCTACSYSCTTVNKISTDMAV